MTVATMTNPSVALIQAGAVAMKAPTARAASMIRATTAVIRAGRLPRRAGTSATSVMSPSTAMTMLTASGGAMDEPMTPSSAMPMTLRIAKMAAGACGRDADGTWWS
jgi:hypothetical protein